MDARGDTLPGRLARLVPARQALAVALLAAALPAAAQVADGTQWIWSAPTATGAAADRASFAAEFVLAAVPAQARLALSADNHADVHLNGALVAHTDEWEQPVLADVASHLLAGRNTLTIEARNDGGPAGLLCFVVADGVTVFRTDAATLAPELPARVIAPYGAEPWGRLDFSGRRSAPPTSRTLVPAEGLVCEEAAEGFGSLIALTVAPDGTPVVSVESGGLLALHDDDGDGRYERSTPFCDELRACQGLGFLDGDAWATGIGPDGLGFYRLRAGGAPGALRHAELVAPITGSAGEHGPHAVVPGPDGRLWLMLGNHVRLGVPAADTSPYRLVYEGSVLPRIVDPNGHATTITAPGGTLFAFEPATGRFELFAAGYRNAYDLAFAPSGDVFTFDSDMEWDIGLPWYRPVRVVHVLPGGDSGWRTGSAKWPAWYPDSLPPVLDTGRGSPTGVLWCDSPALPARWRGTLLLGDWSQGEVLAVHLQPDGCSYRGRSEVLLSGRPLPVTDLAFEPDGALLVSVGGRGTQGALLRVRAAAEPADGSGATAGASSDRSGSAPAAARDGAPAATASADTAAGSGFVAAARPPSFSATTPLAALTDALESLDRVVRYLAARALEKRPIAEVESIATSEPRPAVRAEALVALARQALRDRAAAPAERCRALALPLLAADVPTPTRLVAARALELALLAGVTETLEGDGQPPDPALGAALLPLFPSGSPALDRELAALLARTEPDGARAALLAALDEEDTPEEAAHLLYCLSALRGGADAGQTHEVLSRVGALRGRPGGASYQGYLDAIERRLLAAAPADARDALRTEAHAAAAAPSAAATIRLAHDAPRRDAGRTLTYVRNALDAPERSIAEGAFVFSRSCAACHVRGGTGRAGGPDLSSVGSRLGLEDLLAAVMDPSRDISDQYRSTQVFLRDGRALSGLLVRDDGASLQLLATTGETLTVAAGDIDERRLSSASAMPEGLLDGWSLRSIADLCAYLLGPDAPPPPARSAFEPLFAEGLDGWLGDGAAWSVKGGVLLGDPRAAAPADAVLLSPFALRDFTFECEVLLPDGSGGIAARCAGAEPRGYLAEFGGRSWGSLTDERGGATVASEAVLWEPELAAGGWNHLLLEARGGHLRVVLNGIETAALTQAATGPGALAFRLHADGTAPAAFRLAALRRD